MKQTIEDFITSSRQAQSIDELFPIYKKALNQYGYDQIAHAIISDHQHLSNNHEIGLALEDNMLAWTTHYIANDYLNIDPAFHFTMANSGFFTWDLISQQNMSMIQRNIFTEANEFGLHNGINVSIHGPGGVKCVAVASSSQKVISNPRNTSDMISLITHQFNACFLDLKNHKPQRPSDSLTFKEREILKWLATGLTKSEVGEKIHISQHTVNFHMRNIFKKLSAKNTAAALVNAIKDNLINI